MNAQLVVDVLNQMETRAAWLIVKLIVAAVAVLTLKAVVDSVVAYILFSTDKKFSAGTSEVSAWDTFTSILQCA